MFNLEIFDIKLETDFIGRNFIHCDEIESTNSELMISRQQYKKTGTVFFAEKQLSGKGRKDRTWLSAKGLNLTFSILLSRETIADLNPNHLNLAASLAVAESIENLYQLKTELKWPNDILVDKKKIAGILIETSYKGKNLERVVTGIGINVNQIAFHGDFNIPPTSVKLELSEDVERENILAEILNRFEELLYELEKQPVNVIKDWRSKCEMIGDKITITENDEVKSGIFHDIDENGYLLLKRSNTIEKIYFGDVSFI